MECVRNAALCQAAFCPSGAADTFGRLRRRHITERIAQLPRPLFFRATASFAPSNDEAPVLFCSPHLQKPNAFMRKTSEPDASELDASGSEVFLV